MKTFWDIDVNRKTASFKNGETVYKIRFEVELDGCLTISTVETLEDDSSIDMSKMHTYMRHLGDELNLLHFGDKLKFDGEMDWDGVKMYKLQDNIYIDEDATVCTLERDGFYETDFMCDIDIDNIEETPTNLAKLLICKDDELYWYISFDELAESLNCKGM